MSANTVIVTPSVTHVEVQPQPNNTVVLEAPPPIQVEVRSPGIQGPAGPPGPNTIGGYPIAVASVAGGDVLQFGESAWVNTPQQRLTDGGNF